MPALRLCEILNPNCFTLGARHNSTEATEVQSSSLGAGGQSRLSMLGG